MITLGFKKDDHTLDGVNLEKAFETLENKGADIVGLMKQTDKESFEGALNEWYDRWETFLNERTINEETGRSFYTHKRLRSAYRSLRTNLKWLFTWYDNIELNIPNTTNAIDGHFADLKNKLRNHNGLSKKRKMNSGQSSQRK